MTRDRRKVFGAFLLLACVGQAPSLATEKSYTPADDIHVSNKYKIPGEKADVHKLVIQSSGYVKFPYIRFDFKNFPGSVSSATLTLEHNEGVEDKYPVTFGVYGSRDAPKWSELDLVLSNAPNGPALSPPRLTRGDYTKITEATISSSQDYQLHDFDITPYIQWEAQQGDRSATIILVPIRGAIRWTSRENRSDEASPRLTIVGGSGGSNKLPQAKIMASDITGKVGQMLSFDGSGSTDPDGTIQQFTWDFGDGQAAKGQVARHAWNSPGNYTVKLMVSDNLGATNTASVQVTVVTVDTSPPIIQLVKLHLFGRVDDPSVTRVTVDDGAYPVTGGVFSAESAISSRISSTTISINVGNALKQVTGRTLRIDF